MHKVIMTNLLGIIQNTKMQLGKVSSEYLEVNTSK